MAETDEEGIKHDDGKTRFDLLPVEALTEVANVYTFGCKKYEAHNWRKGLLYSRLFAAALRHLWAFWRGVEIDEESGLPHLAHACFNVLGLLQFEIEHRKELDDRFKQARKTPTSIARKSYTQR